MMIITGHLDPAKCEVDCRLRLAKLCAVCTAFGKVGSGPFKALDGMFHMQAFAVYTFAVWSAFACAVREKCLAFVYT